MDAKQQQKNASHPADKKKPRRVKHEKKERTPREATAFVLGLAALGFAAGGIAMLLWVSVLAAAIFGGTAVLVGFSSLMVGKGGQFPAIVGAIAGFLTVLSAIVSMRLQ